MPVTLLLLDINMPGTSGLEITKQIKPMFDAANANYLDSVEGPNQKRVSFLRPFICYYSNHTYKNFKHVMREEETADAFL